jgi:hypothetical protein
MNLTECEEKLYDREQDLINAEQRLSAMRSVLEKAIKVADLEVGIVETAIEAAFHPETNRARLHEVGQALDALILAVREWQAKHQKS